MKAPSSPGNPRRALLLVIALASLLVGCQSVKISREMQRLRVQEGFGRKYTGDVSEEFYVAPRDVVFIQSLEYEELNLEQQVGPDGRITVPIIGSIRIAGMTARQIEETLSDFLDDYMKKLDLVVLVNVRASKRLFLISDRRGRTIPFTGDVTAFDVVMQATFPQFSNQKRIRIIRADPDDPTILYFNFAAMKRHGDSTTNVQLKEDDIIYIPLTTVGVAFDYLDKALTPLRIIGGAVSTILRGLLIPAQFAGVDEIGDRLREGRVGGRGGRDGGAIFF